MDTLTRLRSANAAIRRRDVLLDHELAAVADDRGPSPETTDAGIQLETIVRRTGRPVLAVHQDEAQLSFDDADSAVWTSRLVQARTRLVRATRAVGRINVEGHRLEWLGTGWLVDDGAVVTNRHVAVEFARHDATGIRFRPGLAGGLMSASVDLLQEVGRDDTLVFDVLEVLHIEDADGPDLALLRVEQADGASRAVPITLADSTAAEELVAVIGYPARDSRVPDVALMDRIFGDVYDKKRLAPGQVVDERDGTVIHDCSTLGGNSGSVVLSLTTGEAVGLHFAGRFLEANYAVPSQVVARRLEHARARPAEQPTSAVLAPVTVEAVASDYRDRTGYDPAFLEAGPGVPLPEVTAGLDDVLTFHVDGRDQQVLDYEHFSVLMSAGRRLCRYSAVNIDGSHSKRFARAGWRGDPRIPQDAQVRDGVYGDPPRFSRGHMTRREDPIWGPDDVAARANADSMHVTNAVPQMQPFNAGIWLDLEDYALQNARRDTMRISVFTGPFLDAADPTRFDLQVPVEFWKVIAFVHEETRALCATGYTMSQRSFLSEEEFVFGAHETAQVSIRSIEERTGLSFGPLTDLDPFVAAETVGSLLTDVSQIQLLRGR